MDQHLKMNLIWFVEQTIVNKSNTLLLRIFTTIGVTIPVTSGDASHLHDVFPYVLNPHFESLDKWRINSWFKNGMTLFIMKVYSYCFHEWLTNHPQHLICWGQQYTFNKLIKKYAGPFLNAKRSASYSASRVLGKRPTSNFQIPNDAVVVNNLLSLWEKNI